MNIKSFFSRPHPDTSLGSIIREIVRISDPEKILLLSATYGYQLTENIYLKNPVQQFRGNSYELLILSPVEEIYELAKMELQIMQKMRDHPVQFALMGIDGFNRKVEGGDAYLTYILLHALLSYDNGRVPFSAPVLGN